MIGQQVVTNQNNLVKYCYPIGIDKGYLFLKIGKRKKTLFDSKQNKKNLSVEKVDSVLSSLKKNVIFSCDKIQSYFLNENFNNFLS